MMPPDTPEDLDVLGVDPETGVAVLFEGGSLLSLQLLTSEPDRFKDILVPADAMAQIHARCGWEFDPDKEAFSVVATDVSGRPVATAEAAPIRWGQEQGLNLSYAVAQDFERQGLAKLCAAYAIQGWCGTRAGISFVSVHMRSGHAASAAVATQLGLVRMPRHDFSAPLGSDVTPFETYQNGFRDVARAALSFLVQRGAFDECMRERMRQGW